MNLFYKDSKMKKYLIILSAMSILAGCTELNSMKKELIPPSFSAQNFVGKWYCHSAYGDWNLNTKEYMDFKPDGTLKNTGILTAPLLAGTPDLKYEYNINAYWQVDGWHIIQKQAEKGKVKRAHDPKVLAAMARDPKLKQKELVLFKLVQEMASGEHSARREIESVTEKEFTTIYKSSSEICSRVE